MITIIDGNDPTKNNETRIFDEYIQKLCQKLNVTNHIQLHSMKIKNCLGCLLFLVQSGFPEAVHSRYIERYLCKLTHRLKCDYIGTIIRGGVESTQQIFPEFIAKKIVKHYMKRIRILGKEFGETGLLNEELLKKCAYPEKLPVAFKIIYFVCSKIGIKYFNFDKVLKKNKAFKLRDSMPYINK